MGAFYRWWPSGTTPIARARVAKLSETPEVAFMLCRNAVSLAFAIAILIPLPAWAGLYYSGENYASLPSQWRGYLLDQRALRNIAVKPMPGQDASPVRVQYEKAADKLQKRLDQDGKLAADDWAGKPCAAGISGTCPSWRRQSVSVRFKVSQKRCICTPPV